MKTSNRLTTLQLPALLKQPGRHRDGDGLILLVRENGSAFWVLRYMLGGKSRELGLGPLRLVNLASARARAKDARQWLLDKVDPVEAKHAALEAKRIAQLKTTTFREAAKQFMATDAVQKLSDPSGWRSTIEQACKTLGNIPLAEIDTALVLKTLLPIWERTPETASRLRGRIERVFAWALAHKLYTGSNPATLALLKDALPSKPKVEHHKAMPYAELPAFMARLSWNHENVSSLALQFLILTAARTSETLGARWSEIDLDAGVWSIPAERMKAREPHRVPLSGRAIEILRATSSGKNGEGAAHIFTNDVGRPLSDMAFHNLLKRMAPGYTAHGMRSSFSDWARDRTGYARDVVEQSLAHAIKDKSEAAYRRGDALEKRARLMAEWARYLEAPAAVGDNVRALRA